MKTHYKLSEAERLKRKRFLNATLITCVTLAMLGGAAHVVRLGANRMADMRDRASYDVSEAPSRIRAAGEDLHLNKINEYRLDKDSTQPYTPAEVEALLPADVWQEIDRTITIPAGSFVMGTDRKRSDAYDGPAHKVELKAYRIDKYPVTNAQYARFVAATGYRAPLHWENGRIPPGKELHPVTMVSWFDARHYAEWAGKRLPSEAEWEKAARGTDARRWPWGNVMDPERLNTYYSVGATNDVRRYQQGGSPYGVMDMAGDVSEWVADDFTAYQGSSAPDEVFIGKVGVVGSQQDQAMKVVDLVAVDEKYKVLRGGSWKSDPFSTSTYHRNYAWPNYASDFFGFRCVTDIAEEGEK